MIGNRVVVFLAEPKEEIAGELRNQTAEGVWIYCGWAEQAAVRFYPTRRILEIRDNGPVYR